MDQDELNNIMEAAIEPDGELKDDGKFKEGQEIITPDHRNGRIDSIQDSQSGTDNKIIRVEILEGPEKGNIVDYTDDDFAQAA